MSSLKFSITDPISSGVARTWFGFRYPDQDQDSQYYSFNVMHIDSQRKDHGLLTQLHGSFHPIGFGDYDYDEKFKKTETEFYSRSKRLNGKKKYFRVVP